MTKCEEDHERFDVLANAEAQVGEFPEGMRVRGKAFWWVHQGPYNGLPGAWRTLGEKFAETDLQSTGPPGDIYICDPADHQEDPENILTILWNPVE